MQNITLLYILSSVFVLFFFIREYAAYKRYLNLKYFFTPSLTLILVAMMIFSIASNGADRYRMMIVLSLLSALVADTLLMIEEVSFLKNGMIFFILGHVFYIGAFSIDASLQPWNIFVIAVIIFLSFLYIKVLIRTAGKMIIPVVLYVFILDVMVYFAVTALNKGLTTSGLLVAAGAVLFMISDFILSVNAFVKTIKNSTVFTWLLYAPAQLLFVLSAFFKQ
ncbi:MAG TPA: lysoplasmalogenase [Spirochaetota bacterium]|nr:lysoplasmalogenase [Spirochaetota bacterium]HPS85623.1 lysoplasmalogenase [Spirochaetota bacterium]